MTDSPKPSHHKNTAVLDVTWLTWWERWGWINTNNHPNNKGQKIRESTNSSKWRFCVWQYPQQPTFRFVCPGQSMHEALGCGIHVEACLTFVLHGPATNRCIRYTWWNSGQVSSLHLLTFCKEILFQFQYLMNFLERIIPDEKWSF